MKVAVIAHSGKTLGGGLPELRRVLEAEGVEEPFWCEIPKSRKAPAQVRRALAEGAELVFAWVVARAPWTPLLPADADFCAAEVAPCV